MKYNSFSGNELVSLVKGHSLCRPTCAYVEVRGQPQHCPWELSILLLPNSLTRELQEFPVSTCPVLRLQAYTNKPGFLHGFWDRNQFLTPMWQAFFCLSFQSSTVTTPVMTLKITCPNTEDATGIFAESLSVVCFVIQLFEDRWHSSLFPLP